MYFYILFSLSFNVINSIELGGILCSQPKNYGYKCGKFKPHIAYYFDINFLKCLKFEFRGCGGNQNRFGTLDECNSGCGGLTSCRKGLPLMDFAGNIKHCDNINVKCPYGYECVGLGSQSVCCKEKENICSLGVEPGCGNNENNFYSKGECMKYCQTEVSCLKGEPYPDRFSPSRSLRCKKNSDCPNNYQCYGKSEENKACCPTIENVCTNKYITDFSCAAKHDIKKVWTFDYKIGICIQKNDISCLDQINSFANLEQCVDYCIGVCPNGMQTHINWLTNQPQLCNFEKQMGCPIGFECMKTSNITAICCKTPPSCMVNDNISFFYPMNNEPIRCNPKVLQSCPSGYQCQEAKNKEYICCKPKIECPFGMEVLKDSKNEVKLCTPGLLGSCPNDREFLCLKASQTNINVCCKTKKMCVSPYVNIHTQKPIKCYPGESKCPDGTNCLEAKNLHIDNFTMININITRLFYCCYDMNVYTCPDNENPIMNTMTGLPEECNPLSTIACPYEYECKALLDNSYACCPTPKKSICREATLNPVTGNPISCTGLDDKLSCLLTNSICKITNNNNYYCCRK